MTTDVTRQVKVKKWTAAKIEDFLAVTRKVKNVIPNLVRDLTKNQVEHRAGKMLKRVQHDNRCHPISQS